MSENSSATKPDDKGGNDEQLREEGMRALKAERKENATLKARLEELEGKITAAEQEKLSKEERLQAQLNEANERVKSLQREAELGTLRRKLAKEKGVPEHLLVGETEDDLASSAKSLQDYIKEQTGSKTPEPNPFLGNEPGNGGDPDTEARKILGF